MFVPERTEFTLHIIVYKFVMHTINILGKFDQSKITIYKQSLLELKKFPIKLVHYVPFNNQVELL